MSEEIFIDAVRSKEDLAGVFEYAEETGYFYLYDLNANEGQKVLDNIQIVSGDILLCEEDLIVRWYNAERYVGLFIKGSLWAGFDTEKHIRFGGKYKIGDVPKIPQEFLPLS
jgi:hypothetical protein